MAHMIDQTTGRAAIAYVGDEPWHGLGQNLTAGASIETWRKEAGLDYTVERAPVLFQPGPEDSRAPIHGMPGRDVLFRSDTKAPLSVVSSGYNIVQPGEVLDFFGKLVEAGGFQLETAGALSDGKRIWGLAKVNDGAPVVGHDVVQPYLLLATSYDGTMATTAQFTAVRVVCHNTITMAMGKTMKETTWRPDQIDGEGPVVSRVRVPHATKFNASAVRRQLGVVINVWDRWLVEARMLAEVSVTESQADKMAFDLLSSVQYVPPGKPLPDIRKGRGYQRIMGLFGGEQIGANQCGWNNAWAFLNACTQYVDHERGKSDDTRMTSAWFGAGDDLKTKAWEAVREIAVKAGALAPAEA